MNKKEFTQLIIGLKTAYPRFQFLETDNQKEFWFTMLEDVEYKVVQNAVLEHIATNAFPPSIAEIRKLCAERCRSCIPGFDEAWGTVQKAISKYGWQHPQEAFESMNEPTRTVVKNLGWSRLCQSENPTADRANFREAYEEKAKELQKNNQIPEFVVKEKALLKEQYIPVIEAKEPPRIEQNEPLHDVREDLTPEQIKERNKMFDDVRRRLMGG